MQTPLQCSSAGKTAAGIALRHLKALRHAAERLVDGDDDALHDFRVALRRLRVILSAYRNVLKPASRRKMRKKLKRLARFTGPARDAQAWVLWLSERKNSAGFEHVSSVIRKLERFRVAAFREIQEKAVGRFWDLKPKLAHRLKKVRRQADVRPLFGPETAKAVSREAGSFMRLLAAYRRRPVATAGHKLRIASKRLRYLLEPWEKDFSLKYFQDLLGEMHDLDGLEIQKNPAAVLTAIKKRKAEIRDELAGGKLDDLEKFVRRRRNFL